MKVKVALKFNPRVVSVLCLDFLDKTQACLTREDCILQVKAHVPLLVDEVFNKLPEKEQNSLNERFVYLQNKFGNIDVMEVIKHA